MIYYELLQWAGIAYFGYQFVKLRSFVNSHICPRCRMFKGTAYYQTDDGKMCGDCYDKMIETDHGITE